jgi:hypothetical protein
MRGSPLRPERIVSWVKDQVRFSYVDNRATKEQGSKVRKFMQLPTEQFVKRLFQHVPEPNVKIIRHWGLYGARCQEELNQCRELLGQDPVAETPEIEWQEVCAHLGSMHPERCPECGTRLVEGAIIKPEREPCPLKLPQCAA